MYQFFVPIGQIKEKEAYIDGTDVNHIKNVLRMKEGERLNIIAIEDKTLYKCRITSMNDEMITVAVESGERNESELPIKVCLFQGLAKGDKMETIIQKAVELGVYEVVPVRTKNAVVKLDDKKASAKVNRYNSIAEAAAKQSKRSMIPQVLEVMDYTDAVNYLATMDVKLVAYELSDQSGMQRTRDILEKIKPGESVGILIGPEGGFDSSEIELALEKGAMDITLGRRILRTETAGMTVLAWLNYLMEK